MTVMDKKKNKIKVLLVDDSAVVRQSLSRVFATAPDIEIIGSVIDPLFALERMKQQWPDVIVLDIEMPRMDGITFLNIIMKEHPTPVVVCSALTAKGAETTLQALSLGAVEVINKPAIGVKDFLRESAEFLIDAVRAASCSDLKKLQDNSNKKIEINSSSVEDAVFSNDLQGSMNNTTDKVVAIGTSTGGTQALELILPALPRVVPGIVVVQHMPEKFTRSFAERLNSLSRINVKEAEDNDRVLPGVALIAPGGRHMVLVRSGAHYHVKIHDGPPVNRHRPSVDVLFRSVAKVAGKNSYGIILTGMGDDGARGLKEMQDVGASTVAQDESTSIVFGMPREAVKHGGVQTVLPLQEIPESIIRNHSDSVDMQQKSCLVNSRRRSM